jgi:hypothetical protein
MPDRVPRLDKAPETVKNKCTKIDHVKCGLSNL